MLPRRARAGLAVPVAPLLGLLLVLAGCGSSSDDDGDGTPAPSKATAACREKWKDLAKEVKDRDQATLPSTLPQRWTSVAATIDYYAASATKDDCATALPGEQKAMAALAAFSTRVAPYDMELRLEKVRSAAEKYASSTPAPAPKAKKGKKQPKQPPKPAEVKAALATLTKQAPVATQQQGPAWQQASVIELTDKASVAKALKDLKFLSTESAGYRASMAALARIKLALAARS